MTTVSTGDIALALATALAVPDAVTPGLTLAAERSWLPLHERSELQDLTVTVFPASLESDNESRRASARDHIVQIGIQQLVATTDGAIDEAAVDALATIAQQVFNWTEGIHLAGIPKVSWLRSRMPLVCDAEMLRTGRHFASVIEVHFRHFQVRA